MAPFYRSVSRRKIPSRRLHEPAKRPGRARGDKLMSGLFHIVMKIVCTVIGLMMVLVGGVWVLQGLDIAFQGDSFMAGNPQWSIYGAILAVVGLGQAIWSVTRRR